MKIVHLTNSDSKGGAARACYRIHRALIDLGHDSKILTQQKLTDDKSVIQAADGFFGNTKTIIRKGLDWLFIKFFTKGNRGRFTLPYFGTDIADYNIIKDADIISLHWINEGFLSLKSLKKIIKLDKPIVWTFHDMWAFTGGCHYTGGCNNFVTECSNCPSLIFPSDKDFSNKIFNNKDTLYHSANLSIITCSNWLADEVRKSKLLKNNKTNAIANPIESDVYIQYNKAESRAKLKLPNDKFLILFVSMTVNDERKGFTYLKKALMQLDISAVNKENIELLILGSADESLFNDFPFKANLVGRLSNPKDIAECYSAADLFVAPSLEDNLPNTVMESLSCCTPVIAFNIGGMPDMIEHKQNGYLANEKDDKDLLNGILWFMNLEETERKIVCANARQKVINNFKPEIIAKKYIKFYESLL